MAETWYFYLQWSVGIFEIRSLHIIDHSNNPPNWIWGMLCRMSIGNWWVLTMTSDITNRPHVRSTKELWISLECLYSNEKWPKRPLIRDFSEKSSLEIHIFRADAWLSDVPEVLTSMHQRLFETVEDYREPTIGSLVTPTRLSLPSPEYEYWSWQASVVSASSCHLADGIYIGDLSNVPGSWALGVVLFLDWDDEFLGRFGWYLKRLRWCRAWHDYVWDVNSDAIGGRGGRYFEHNILCIECQQQF